jgi:hypothetical protein
VCGVASALAGCCAITTKTLLESVGETGTPSWTRRTVASHITLTIAQVHEPLYRLSGSRWKIERALKSESKRIFERTSQRSGFGSEFLPYGIS